MLRTLAALLLPAVLLMTPGPADAQWPVYQRPRFSDYIAGPYVNTSNNGQCYVQARGGSYAFINENGSEAIFQLVGPRQLRQIAGDWDPSVVATLTTDRGGRTMIRFDSPNNPPGYWVRAY